MQSSTWHAAAVHFISRHHKYCTRKSDQVVSITWTLKKVTENEYRVLKCSSASCSASIDKAHGTPLFGGLPSMACYADNPCDQPRTCWRDRTSMLYCGSSWGSPTRSWRMLLETWRSGCLCCTSFYHNHDRIEEWIDDTAFDNPLDCWLRTKSCT